jgi:PPOX class probable F420-dependent enzyme
LAAVDEPPVAWEHRAMPELPAEVRELLGGANFVHVATLMPDGSPHSVAVWGGVEGEHVVFFTQSSSRKARNLARDGRLALSLVDRDNPYRTARVRGHVAGTLEGDAALEVIDRLSQKYVGRPFPMRSGVVFLVEADHATVHELPFHDTPARG